MKKVKVNEEACIRCGVCMSIAGEVFGSNSAGLSTPKVDEVSDDNKEAIEAMENCPTGAIILEELAEDCNCGECHCEHCECKHEEE